MIGTLESFESFENLYARGVEALNQKKWHESEKYFRLARKIQPNHACLNHLLGKALSSQGFMDEALECQIYSCELDSSLGWNWFESGEIYVTKYQYDRAYHCFDNAYRMLSDQEWIKSKRDSLTSLVIKQRIDAFFADNHWKPCFDWRKVREQDIIEKSLIELSKIRAAESNHLASDFLQLCYECGFTHPLFNDAEAWILYSECQFNEAEKIWKALAENDDTCIKEQARQTLKDLFLSPSVETEIQRIFMLKAHDKNASIWKAKLFNLWLKTTEKSELMKLRAHIRSIAISLSDTSLIDASTAYHEFLINLCYGQVEYVEQLIST